MKKTDTKEQSPKDGMSLSEEVGSLKKQLEIQRRIAFAAGLFQGDVTIRTMLES